MVFSCGADLFILRFREIKTRYKNNKPKAIAYLRNRARYGFWFIHSNVFLV